MAACIPWKGKCNQEALTIFEVCLWQGNKIILFKKKKQKTQPYTYEILSVQMYSPKGC